MPHALVLPAFSPRTLARVMHTVHRRTGRGWPTAAEAEENTSNAVARLWYADGRSLMVKQGVNPWDAPRFAAARHAARLLADTPVRAPAPLDLDAEVGEGSLEAYWRIDLPVLKEVWAEIPAAERLRTLRSWGRLLAAIHRVRVDGFGPLGEEATRAATLAEHLAGDLVGRLLPATWAHWPGGAADLEALVELIPAVAARVRTEAVLVHHDPHAGNILVRRRGEGAECEGVLDLEVAAGETPEADVARVDVLHGPLFTFPLPDGAMDEVRRGYGRGLDEEVVSFYRAVHLSNLGFHAAFTGLAEHAADIGAALRAELGGLARRLNGRRPRAAEPAATASARNLPSLQPASP